MTGRRFAQPARQTGRRTLAADTHPPSEADQPRGPAGGLCCRADVAWAPRGRRKGKPMRVDTILGRRSPERAPRRRPCWSRICGPGRSARDRYLPLLSPRCSRGRLPAGPGPALPSAPRDAGTRRVVMASSSSVALGRRTRGGWGEWRLSAAGASMGLTFNGIAGRRSPSPRGARARCRRGSPGAVMRGSRGGR